MTTIHDAYINALLADATYAFDREVTDGLTKDELLVKLNQSTLTLTPLTLS